MYSVPRVDSVISHVRQKATAITLDSLNYGFATIILIAAAISISGNIYAIKPIDCYPSTTISAQSVSFVEARCLLNGTYIEIKNDGDKNVQRKYTDYYSWMCLALLLEAFCFYLPFVAWELLLGLNSGVPVRTFISKAQAYSSFPLSANHVDIESIAMLLKASIKSAGRYGKYWQHHVTFSYLLIKVLYLTNSLGQLWFLKVFLSETSLFWGAELLSDIATKGRSELRFPREARCDTKVIDGSTWHTSTINCVLNANVLAEKVFLLAWAMTLSLSILNAVSLLYWLVVSTLPYWNQQKIWSYIQRSDRVEILPSDKKRLRRDLTFFMSTELCQDGLTILRFMEEFGNCDVVENIIIYLWLEFQGPS